MTGTVYLDGDCAHWRGAHIHHDPLGVLELRGWISHCYSPHCEPAAAAESHAPFATILHQKTAIEALASSKMKKAQDYP